MDSGFDGRETNDRKKTGENGTPTLNQARATPNVVKVRQSKAI